MQISIYRDILNKHWHDTKCSYFGFGDSALISASLSYISGQIHIITKSSSKLSEVKKKISIFNQILKGGKRFQIRDD